MIFRSAHGQALRAALGRASRHDWLSPGRWRERVVLWVGGLAVGLAAVGLAHGADRAQHLFNRLTDAHPAAPLLITPLTFALLVHLTRGRLRVTRGSGIPQTIAVLRLPDRRLRREVLSIPAAAGKLVFTTAALLGGASVGREGPTVHLGAALMFHLGRPFGFASRRAAGHLILAGAAAGLAAAFNTPLAGLVFAIEELAGTFEQRMSGVLMTAVILAGALALGLVGNYAYFGHVRASLPPGQPWLAVPLTGVVCGLAGGAFARALLLTPGFGLGRLAAVRARYPVRFAAACGAVLAAVSLLSGQHLYGSGYDQAKALLDGAHHGALEFGLLKGLATAVSYWSGIPGGLFAPALSIGAGLGGALAAVVPAADGPTVVVLGMAAFLAGMTQAPLTAAVIAFELTANHGLVVATLATCLVARAAAAPLCPVPLYRAFAQQVMQAFEARRTAPPTTAPPPSEGPGR